MQRALALFIKTPQTFKVVTENAASWKQEFLETEMKPKRFRTKGKAVTVYASAFSVCLKE